MIYEILYIIPSRFSDTEIEAATKVVDAALAKHGATVQKTENLGKLKLAYPIKKERHGTYILTYIEGEGENVAKIENELKLTDEVLRHTIVKREEGIPEQSFQVEQYEAPITAEGKRIHKKVKIAADAPKPRPATAKSEISEAELDKKLDSILDDSDLGSV